MGRGLRPVLLLSIYFNGNSNNTKQTTKIEFTKNILFLQFYKYGHSTLKCSIMSGAICANV